MNPTQIIQAIERMEEHHRAGPVLTPEGGYLGVGFETRRPGEEYRWDGLRRGIDPAHPNVVFQYGLAGWGAYQESGVLHRIVPGVCFAAYLPSDHVYFLPPDSPGWSYFWVMLQHPYACERIARVKEEMGAVAALPSDGAMVARLLKLYEGVRMGGFRDGWAQEQALFEWLWEYERARHQARYTPSRRERLLEEVRRDVLARLSAPPDVEALAEARGMSRSHFSHDFKAATGLSPAAFVTQVRLEEAARRLVETDKTLEAVAQETGFASATHFCKVFRRRSHLSPGEFRRQMR